MAKQSKSQSHPWCISQLFHTCSAPRPTRSSLRNFRMPMADAAGAAEEKADPRDCYKGGPSPALNEVRVLPSASINRVFAVIYACALFALFYRHALSIRSCTTFVSVLIQASLLLADAVLAFSWSSTQAFRMRPVRRREFPENLPSVIPRREDYPCLDVFICTADPYKEPPMGVANTALSVMAYEYPLEKITVYVSDDGGSELTLFALIEAAKFARHWLPLCRERNLTNRNPEVYFRSCPGYSSCSQAEKIKTMYDGMKSRIEGSVETGRVIDDYLPNDNSCSAFDVFRKEEFTRQEHQAVVEIIIDGEKDAASLPMPDLVYVSREKNRAHPHHFKAGALNALLRVSATLTNAPVVLTLDCDTYSNDPETPNRAMCYISDPSMNSTLGYVQFPQKFHGINRMDSYACEHKRLFHINSMGMDGLRGPNYVGTGCFFLRRAFFGPPFALVQPEIPELNPDRVVQHPSNNARALARRVAGCAYENGTSWGSLIGFRYGSLVEDYYTGYRLQCEGWRSVFCNPHRRAFLGDIPISLHDTLSQCKRWSVGLLEVLFSEYSTVTHGVRSMGLLMAHCYTHYALWPIAAIPVAIYAILPQLALSYGFPVFPTAADPWICLYAFLFLGAYAQDFLDFVLAGGTPQRWWSDQKMWIVRGLTCFPFGSFEYLVKVCGVRASGFDLTSKAEDEERSKRYEQGVFEFGVAAPMFVPLATAALVNAVALARGLLLVFVLEQNTFEALLGQILLAGFMFVNFLPVYQAMALRNDAGRMPTKITLLSIAAAAALFSLSKSCMA